MKRTRMDNPIITQNFSIKIISAYDKASYIFWEAGLWCVLGELTLAWLQENIGEFGEEWYIQFDDENEIASMFFKKENDAVLFTLTWM